MFKHETPKPVDNSSEKRVIKLLVQIVMDQFTLIDAKNILRFLLEMNFKVV